MLLAGSSPTRSYPAGTMNYPKCRDAQRVIRRDAGYRHPEIEQVCRTLNGGTPANAADLSPPCYWTSCEELAVQNPHRQYRRLAPVLERTPQAVPHPQARGPLPRRPAISPAATPPAFSRRSARGAVRQRHARRHPGILPRLPGAGGNQEEPCTATCGAPLGTS